MKNLWFILAISLIIFHVVLQSKGDNFVTNLIKNIDKKLNSQDRWTYSKKSDSAKVSNNQYNTNDLLIGAIIRVPTNCPRKNYIKIRGRCRRIYGK